MTLSLSEQQALRTALEDIAFRQAFAQFAESKAAYHRGNVVSEVRKSQPDLNKAAQDAGRLDAYESLFQEFELFVTNQTNP